MARVVGLLVFALLFLPSCDTSSEMLVPASASLRGDAVVIAEKYLGMHYAWGGQSWWNESEGTIDCSGLVVNVYKEAAAMHGASLLFDDTTAFALAQSYTMPISSPSAGDLVFMGDDRRVTHVAICTSCTPDSVDFIDAYSVAGKVVRRSYPLSSAKIISYGRMLVRHPCRT